MCFILWFYNRVVSIAMSDYQMVIDGFITHTLQGNFMVLLLLFHNYIPLYIMMENHDTLWLFTALRTGKSPCYSCFSSLLFSYQGAMFHSYVK